MERIDSRPATADDEDLVFDIKRAAFRPYVEATWGRWDDAEQRRLHASWFRPEVTEVLLDDGEPVGSLHVARKPDEIVLVSVYILPAWQSKGIGTSIVDGLLEEAADRQVPIRLRVLKTNERARAFYERHGFRVTETTDTHDLMRRSAGGRPRSRWSSVLFPDPERHVPGERQLRTLLRTVHIASIAVLLGGHFFDVPRADLVGALRWSVGTGLLLVLLEVYGSLNWLFQVRGLVTVLKVGLVCAVPLFWEQRVWILMAVLAIGSFSSHTTARIRYYSILTGKLAERKSG